MKHKNFDSNFELSKRDAPTRQTITSDSDTVLQTHERPIRHADSPKSIVQTTMNADGRNSGWKEQRRSTVQMATPNSR